MLDREVIGELLDKELKERRIKIPKDVSNDVLTETFCRYVEGDYYEWIKDNFQSFFNHGIPDWNWIKGRVDYYSKI